MRLGVTLTRSIINWRGKKFGEQKKRDIVRAEKGFDVDIFAAKLMIEYGDTFLAVTFAIIGQRVI